MKKHTYWLIACVVLIAFSALMAHLIERDFGNVNVQYISIVDDSGTTITGKLFKPAGASPENKLPAVLNLHGGSNDKDSQDALSIELARRGFVVLAPDGFGQGDSQGLQNAAFVFINPKYTQGRNFSYVFMKSLPFVDANNTGIVGHSMGGGDAFKIVAMNPGVKSLVSLDGGGGVVDTNVLYIKPTMSDMSEGAPAITPTIDPTWCKQDAGTPLTWDTTYGDVASGTACKTTLVPSNHDFLPVSSMSVAQTVDWFQLTLKANNAGAAGLDPNSQIYWWKEIFSLLALLVTIFSLIPLSNLLFAVPFFKTIMQPMPTKQIQTNGSWWVLATINTLIGAVTYPYLTALGGTLSGVEKVLPFMKLSMGNGIVLWMVVNILLCAISFYFWYRNTAKKSGITMYDLGVSFETKKTKLDGTILAKTLLFGVILFAWMYLLEGLSQWALGEEFRFIWPMMRQFNEPLRVGQFIIYLIPMLLYFLVNGGILLYGLLKQKEYATENKTQWMWWLKILYASLFGLFLVWFIQYVPWMLFSTGGLLPGIINSGTVWSIWPLEIVHILPQFIVMLFMMTWFYRKTGKIYLGAFFAALVTAWIFAAGSVLTV